MEKTIIYAGTIVTYTAKSNIQGMEIQKQKASHIKDVRNAKANLIFTGMYTVTPVLDNQYPSYKN